MKRSLVFVNAEKLVQTWLILSLFLLLFAASSTPAVNIQPDISGGWDWHAKSGKGQKVIFVFTHGQLQSISLYSGGSQDSSGASVSCVLMFPKDCNLEQLFLMHLLLVLLANFSKSLCVNVCLDCINRYVCVYIPIPQPLVFSEKPFVPLQVV